MAIFLDAGQRESVSLKQKKPADRPDYYNATLAKSVQITADFEAFLILQGSQRNRETMNWLELAQQLMIQDGDRDSLAATTLANDKKDAESSQNELFPLIDLFSRFKQNYLMTGFEEVAEAGLLLADMQAPMLEMQSIMNRLVHRSVYGKVTIAFISNSGVTTERQKQIDSWYTPLTSY
jgi:hypothetical protein